MNSSFSVFVLLFVQIVFSQWKYPSWDWKNNKNYKCDGKEQSPVNITTSQTIKTKSLLPIFTHYKNSEGEVYNNGYTFQINFKVPRRNVITNTNPKQPGDFCLAQLHFHWGSKPGQGSEHIIDGIAYEMEVHLVHYECEAYNSIGDALNDENGRHLLVLGILIQLDDEAIHGKLEELSKMVKYIPYKNNKSPIKNFNPSVLLPDDMSAGFYYYQGGLTTPGCQEAVHWHLLKTPIKVTTSQLERFKTLYNQEQSAKNKSFIVDNYRHPEPLFARRVYDYIPVIKQTEKITLSVKKTSDNKYSTNVLIGSIFGTFFGGLLIGILIYFAYSYFKGAHRPLSPSNN